MEKKKRKVLPCVNMLVSPELKEAFGAFCESRGLATSRAVRLFAKRLAGKGEVPFQLGEDIKVAEEDMVRMCLHTDAETRKQLDVACEKYGVSVSFLVRAFMDYCVSNNRFPDGMG